MPSIQPQLQVVNIIIRKWAPRPNHHNIAHRTHTAKARPRNQHHTPTPRVVLPLPKITPVAGTCMQNSQGLASILAINRQGCSSTMHQGQLLQRRWRRRGTPSLNQHSQHRRCITLLDMHQRHNRLRNQGALINRRCQRFSQHQWNL